MEKTFEEVWTADTVKKILKEYEEYSSTYLCFASKTFKEIWYLYSFKKELQELALKFDPTDETLKKAVGEKREPCDCLFYDNSCRAQRINFLESEIKRLSK